MEAIVGLIEWLSEKMENKAIDFYKSFFFEAINSEVEENIILRKRTTESLYSV